MEETRYVVVDKFGKTKLFKNTVQVDKYLSSRTGIFYLLTIYPLYTTVEEFVITDVDHKRIINRLDIKVF